MGSAWIEADKESSSFASVIISAIALALVVAVIGVSVYGAVLMVRTLLGVA